METLSRVKDNDARIPYTIEKGNRLNKYFDKYMGTYLYVGLSKDFTMKMGFSTDEDLKIPIRPENLEDFSKDNGKISITKIAENMVFVVGCNSDFKYSDKYVKFISEYFDKNLVGNLVTAGVNAANDGELEKSCIFFRSALRIIPNTLEAVYNYARVCRDIYMKSDDEEEIGMFKAESIEAFEELTLAYPDFQDGYYFLGYAYLNMGLYEKAGISWEKYLEIGDNQDAIIDISERLRQIQEPRVIEKGCNLIIKGSYGEGYNILLRFVNSEYKSWWPLHFYIGMAQEELGEYEKAVESYKNSLKLNAGNIGAIDGLIRVYGALDDEENKRKYLKKKTIIVDNFREISIDN